MFSTAQREFIYDSYVLSQSAREVQRRFETRFPGVKVPCRQTVHTLYTKFQKTGSVQPKKRNRQRRVLTEEALEDIGRGLEQSPAISIRRLAQQTGISYGSVQRGVDLLKLNPCKITVAHGLQPGDSARKCSDAEAKPEKRKLLQVSEFPESKLLDIACEDKASPPHMEPDIGESNLSPLKEPAPEFVSCSIKTEPPDVFIPSFSPHDETVIDNTLDTSASRTIKSEPIDECMDVNAPDTLGGSSFQQNFHTETVTNALEQQESKVDTRDESAQFVLVSVLENGRVDVKIEPDIVIKTELEIENDGSPTDRERYSLQSCDIGGEYQGHEKTDDNSQFQENSSSKACYQGKLSEIETTQWCLEESTTDGSVLENGPNSQLDVREGLLLPSLTPKNVFSCSECSKVFGRRDHLQTHMRIHTGEKPFLCSICNKSFARKSDVKKHSQIHSGEKTFVCSTCNKAFLRSDDLKKHSASHTGKKTYACATCNKAFTRKDYMRKHLRIHTGQKPFECSTCYRAFARKGDLKTHSRIHSGEKAFFCPACNKGFTRKRSLYKHLRKGPAQGKNSVDVFPGS